MFSLLPVGVTLLSITRPDCFRADSFLISIIFLAKVLCSRFCCTEMLRYQMRCGPGAGTKKRPYWYEREDEVVSGVYFVVNNFITAGRDGYLTFAEIDDAFKDDLFLEYGSTVVYIRYSTKIFGTRNTLSNWGAVLFPNKSSANS